MPRNGMAKMIQGIEEALAYWHWHYERDPEPLKSFAREHLNHLLELQDQDEAGAPKEK